jgi:hypothetical protein
MPLASLRIFLCFARAVTLRFTLMLCSCSDSSFNVLGDSAANDSVSLYYALAALALFREQVAAKGTPAQKFACPCDLNSFDSTLMGL